MAIAERLSGEVGAERLEWSNGWSGGGREEQGLQWRGAQLNVLTPPPQPLAASMAQGPADEHLPPLASLSRARFCLAPKKGKCVCTYVRPRTVYMADNTLRVCDCRQDGSTPDSPKVCNTNKEDWLGHKSRTKHKYRLLTQEEKQRKQEQLRDARRRGAAALAEHAGVARIAQAAVWNAQAPAQASRGHGWDAAARPRVGASEARASHRRALRPYV